MSKRDKRVVDRVRLQVYEPRLQRPILLDRALAGQPPVDIVVGAEHRADLEEDLRFVPLDPSELAGDELLIDAIARLGQKGPLVDLGAKLVDLSAATRVALLDARTQQ